ncbi:MAG: winged helix-turn-helix domain-containing protein [Acidobacteriota bacterium]|nr:winged helix-turn-helix domain-containing protein [Acidobacteriota bacterium]
MGTRYAQDGCLGGRNRSTQARDPRDSGGRRGAVRRESAGAPGKTSLAILKLLKEDPGLSIPEMASHLHKSESAIERAIRKLREAGRLERVGPAKGGHWRVIE